jgi:tRNA(Arg) A34 adenosine deaminase TadA
MTRYYITAERLPEGDAYDHAETDDFEHAKSIARQMRDEAWNRRKWTVWVTIDACGETVGALF